MFDGEAIIIEGGGGDGGGGNDSGGGGEVEELEEHVEGADDAGGGSGDEDQHRDDDGGDRGGEDDQRGGGRVAPSDVRKAIRSIAEASPDFLKKFPKFEKQVTGALFTRQQVDQLGGMRTVSETMQKIDSFGGLEGIEEAIEDAEASRELEKGLERGDPAIIAGWAKDFPDGFKRSIMPSLDTLEKVDEERYEHVGSYIVTKLFEKFGAFGAVTELGKAIQAMKDDDPAKKEASKHFNAFAGFLKQTRDLAGRAKTDPYASRATELDERENRVSEEAAKNFRAIVRSEVNNQVGRELNNELRKWLAQRKIYRVEGRVADRMRKEINEELKRLVASEPDYARRYSAVMDSRDRVRAQNFVIKTAQRHIAKAVSRVAPDFNLRPSGNRPGGGGPRRKAGGSEQNRGGGGDGTRTVSGVPKTSDVNFNKTPMSTFLATKRTHGQAWLKNGSLAKW